MKKKFIKPDKNLVKKYEPVNKDIIESWFILLKIPPETSSTIQQLLENRKIISSESKLREHLNYLHDKEFLKTQNTERNKTFYELSDAAPILSVIEENDAFGTFAYYYLNTGHAEDEGAILKDIAEKFSLVIPDYSIDTFSEFKTFGRFNNISNDMRKKLEDFLKLDFQKKVIEIEYLNSKNEKTTTLCS